MDDFEQRRRSLQVSRLLIRAELAFAFAAIAGIAYIAAPSFMGDGMIWVSMSWELRLLVALAPWAGVAGTLVGVAWMLRLSRPDPEPGQRSWRYRDF